MSRTQTIQYWLATSAVEFTGTRTTVTPTHGGKPKPTDIANATLLVRADHVQGPVPLELKESELAESKFALTFSDDGRLTSSDAATTGTGAQILGSVASIAGALVQTGVAATAAVSGIVAVHQPDKESVAKGDAKGRVKAYPQEKLLEELTHRQNDLAKQLSDATATLADDGSDAHHLAAIDKALHLVTQERARLTQEQKAWTSASTSVTETFDYILDVESLPTTAELKAGLKAPGNAAALRVWDHLHIMVTLDPSTQPDHVSVGAEEGPAAPYDEDAQTNIWYRLPRRALMSVWSLDEHGEATLVRAADVDVLDKNCRHLSLPLELGGIFRKTDFKITMGANGTPTAIGSDQDSGVAAALGAFAGAPKLVSGGMTDVAGVQKAWQTSSPSAATKEIAALQATKDKLQLLSDIAKLQGH